MKKKLLPILLVIILFSMSMYLESTQETPGIIIYKHANFQGMIKFIPIGQSYSSLRTIKWNDKISSIRLIRNGIVKIYDHDNYSGDTTTITDDVADMAVFLQDSQTNWNDRVSSLKVVDRNTENNTQPGDLGVKPICVFYDNVMKTGIPYKSGLGNYSKIKQEWKGRINSIRIEPGFKIVIYEKENFQGKQLVLMGKAPLGTSYNLVDFKFDKIVSSYKIIPVLFNNRKNKDELNMKKR